MELLAETENSLHEILLVPGLFEPRWAMWPLRWSLQIHCRHVVCWQDRLAFRRLETSISRLTDRISGDPGVDGPIGIVTHSFGDWIARAAVARQPSHRVTKLVSLAPVIRAGFLPTMIYALTGNLIPEIAVTMDAKRASANLDCDPRVRRMVIWSKFDESVRRVDLTQFTNIETRNVMATHLTIGFQPNVHWLVNEFMFHETE